MSERTFTTLSSGRVKKDRRPGHERQAIRKIQKELGIKYTAALRIWEANEKLRAAESQE